MDEFVTAESTTKQVTFGMQTTFEAMNGTRSTSNASPTLLLVLDAAPDGSVKTYTRNVSSDTDVEGDPLDNLSIPLLYGNHTLYFVAADSPLQMYDTTELTVKWDGSTGILKNCWAQKLELNVNQEINGSQQVTMPIRVANIQVVISEGIIAEASTIDMSLSAGCWQLDLKTMKGTEGMEVQRQIEVLDQYIGAKGLTLNIYSFVPEGTNTVGTMTVSASDQEQQVITSHVLSNVPAAEAQITRYTGMFFHNQQDFTLSVENEWNEENLTY